MTNKPQSPDFPGITRPTTDFAAVLDGRRAPIQVYELDLSTARSFTAGTAVQIKISGNSFFIDQAPDVGTGFVVFEGVQDNTGPKIRPAVYVQPGFPLHVPFANIWVANTAQAGKVLRILYGVDVDFQAATSASFGISGTVNAVPYGAAYGASYKSVTALLANTPDTVFAPGANVNGAIIWSASAAGRNASTQAALLAKNAAPATVIDGDVLSQTAGVPGFAAGDYAINLLNPVFVAAGKGAYFITTGADTIVAQRSANYTLL